jgi:hypothetical protein
VKNDETKLNVYMIHLSDYYQRFSCEGYRLISIYKYNTDQIVFLLQQGTETEHKHYSKFQFSTFTYIVHLYIIQWSDFL